MSNYRLPWQKGTELFPTINKNPVQIRFEGVERGTPEARRLFDALSGPIGQFYQKSAQAYDLSLIQQSASNITLPGLSMRYRNNQGDETLFVSVQPVYRKLILDTRKDPKSFSVPTLVFVDIIFRTHPDLQHHRWDLGPTEIGSGEYLFPTENNTWRNMNRFSVEAVVFPEADSPIHASDAMLDVGTADTTGDVDTFKYLDYTNYPYVSDDPWVARFAKALPELMIPISPLQLSAPIYHAWDQDPGQNAVTTLVIKPLDNSTSIPIELSAMSWNLLMSSDRPAIDGTRTPYEFTWLDDVEVKIRVREAAATTPRKLAVDPGVSEKHLYSIEGDPDLVVIGPDTLYYTFGVAGAMKWGEAYVANALEVDETADPDNPDMGKVIAESEWTSVTLNHPDSEEPDPTPFPFPVWPYPKHLGAPGLMQPIATVVYTPPANKAVIDGTAKIEFI